MGVDGNFGDGGGGVYKGGAEGNIIDEVSVHHVKVKPVCTCGFGALYFLVEAAEVAGQDGGSHEDGVHLKVKVAVCASPWPAEKRETTKRSGLAAKNVAWRAVDALESSPRSKRDPG